ncbi:plexin domain-containing protein 2 [Vanessa tameamea]|uniref:Plexin domain-containing protein 2 n=1 Tax=Vanessa tameamea TaxID=334116 RepID=A0ABM4AYF7_VANTA
MDFLQLEAKANFIVTLLFITLSFTFVATVGPEYVIVNRQISHSDIKPEFVAFDRQRRDADVASPAAPPTSPTASPIATNITNIANTTAAITINTTASKEKSVNETEKTTSKTVADETNTPLLGFNNSGTLHVNVPDNMPKVSDPILPDDNVNDVFKETPETIKAEQNLTQLNYDNHSFYNSTFIGSVEYFQEYWANITQHKPIVHELLSDSHRRATTLTLSFDFPFYGHPVKSITVATGGFIYTGDHVHNWLAATQYIAPLMANFDTKLTNDSVVKLSDDGEKFTVFWENVTLQEDPSKKFTFAVTLYKNGDIIFAYKDIPIPVQAINDTEHPVKVGISDAYLNDKILFYVRRKTIYEYHRVSFKNHEISNMTILKLVALPTCLQYDSCQSCVNHDTGFNCLWCEYIKKCSSGTDRNKQDWLLRNCDKFTISKEASCPGNTHVDQPAGGNTAYTTDTRTSHETAVVNNGDAEEPMKSTLKLPTGTSPAEATYASSPVGGVVAAFVAITLVCSFTAWVLYAFKNPHTRSGQILIKYRPSQWSWRRGEARYTAATIHM